LKRDEIELRDHAMCDRQGRLGWRRRRLQAFDLEAMAGGSRTRLRHPEFPQRISVQQPEDRIHDQRLGGREKPIAEPLEHGKVRLVPQHRGFDWLFLGCV